MKRIVIIGSGGSGKSTLARQLGERLNIGVYHLDALFWKPNWVGVPKEEQIAIQKRLVLEDEWICDGNYGGTMDIRLHAADTIIFLNLPRTLCMYRVLKRAVQYRNRTRPDMGEGCEERVSFQFLKWVWEYPKKKRPGILRKLDHLSLDKKIYHLSSKKEIDTFLSNIGGDERVQ
ncbi:DNA topology modulation protein [Guptibacillus algicola]|uniref:DNA topology modulation protein n=1 Tax=Guptibacillus algicola TaxID=225844 RepID=UPI001CD3367A|nr:DNA topology modulation protein [Alkalihalobacillus algicola]MCA0988540.1 DNA topology modulation protein [Alkalihalobacillus algicola]